ARVWNDAYNANPASMVAALVALAAEPARRRIAVLGEMWELGSEAGRYHRETGRRAAETEVDVFVAVGRYADEMASGAADGGLSAARVRRFDSPEAAAGWLRGELRGGDVVLVKGSRGARMEEVLRGLGDVE
ncbi:MAG: glutamate ligase domain-containing protein, partial [Candidatus Binatia bacterium]